MAEHPEHLRERATALRRSARRLDASELHELPRLAGAGTWIGPAATLYRETLAGHARRLTLAADGLREAADMLVRRAELIEAEQRRLTPLVAR